MGEERERRGERETSRERNETVVFYLYCKCIVCHVKTEGGSVFVRRKTA